MNSYQAKNLNFPDLLARLGYRPVEIRKGGTELWYQSPFREEQEASFHISRGHTWAWVWKDFGDEGGTVIDFIMRYHNHRDLKQALQFLENLYQGKPAIVTTKKANKLPKEQDNLFSFHQQSAAKPPDASDTSILELLSAHAISNPLIHAYLEGRGISQRLADLYLKEITYRNTQSDKEYFGFGMQNESGGYEIRSASNSYSFKSALNGRDITRIRGLSPNRRTVNIFEGMTDFLSLLVMMRTDNLSGDSIILHSLSSYRKANKLIQREGYTTIHTFLDNNRAGQGATERFLTDFPQQAISQSSLFAPYTDLNDALKANDIPDLLTGS